MGLGIRRPQPLTVTRVTAPGHRVLSPKARWFFGTVPASRAGSLCPPALHRGLSFLVSALSSLLLHPACSFCSPFFSGQADANFPTLQLGRRRLTCRHHCLLSRPCCCRCSAVSSFFFSSVQLTLLCTGKYRTTQDQAFMEPNAAAAQANHSSPHMQKMRVFTNHRLASSLC